MKVVITPYLGDSNPYTRLLADALKAKGVEVVLQQPPRYFSLWRAALDHQWPDIIHLQRQHGYFRKDNFIWAFINTIMFWLQWFTLRMLGVRFVWTVHNIVNHEKHLVQWELKWCRLLARVVDGIIVHCPSVIPIVAETYRICPERLQVVSHGHYSDWYSMGVTKEKARQELGLPTTARILLFFGMIREYKGLDQLLDSFADLNAENTILVLVGKPQPESFGLKVSVWLTSNPQIVARLEYVSDEILINYISACDWVVLPYKDILTSGAIILAASCGRPILAPRLGCMSEFPPEAAILYDPDDPKGLQMALKKALSASCKDMGIAARQYIDQFPWSQAAAKTLDVYQSVLSK